MAAASGGRVLPPHPLILALDAVCLGKVGSGGISGSDRRAVKIVRYMTAPCLEKKVSKGVCVCG